MTRPPHEPTAERSSARPAMESRLGLLSLQRLEQPCGGFQVEPLTPFAMSELLPLPCGVTPWRRLSLHLPLRSLQWSARPESPRVLPAMRLTSQPINERRHHLHAYF